MKRRTPSIMGVLCVALVLSSMARAGGAPRAGDPAATAAPAATPGPNPAAATTAADAPDESTDSIIQQVKQNRRRLTNAVISAPNPAAARSELHEAIRRVQSITLKPRPVPTETAAAPQSKKPPADTPTQTGKPTPAILSAERLEQLKSLKADEVVNPIALADALVCSGHHDLAFPLYEQLLGDAKTAKPTKAWLLFQMANCKRQADPTTAVSLYSRLLTEHPESPWAGPGKVYKTILEWRQAMRPEAILELLSATPTKPAPKGKAE